MRTQVLNALKQGIVRLRTKGGADPSTLYDLLNGYVTIDGGIKSRPGTVQDATLPAGTKGLCAFDGGLVVFSDSAKTGMPAGYTCAVLPHPTDQTQTITEIHFAAPFLGHLFVVAEFANGDIFYYWVAGATTWSASANYNAGDSVHPTVPNGYVYTIGEAELPQVWQANKAYGVGDVVVPSTLNNWKYTCIEADGDHPSSGAAEPDWPTADGATITEDTQDAQTPVVPPMIPSQPPGGDRYMNPGGSGGNPRTRIGVGVSRL